MRDLQKHGNGSEAPAGAALPPPDDPLKELRRLLLVPEEEQVVKLQERLDDPEIHAEDVSRVLPEAVALRSSRDRDLTRALLPSVEEAIVTSARKNPQVLVDALFPVMGPAIRKAISSALAGMLQSFNQTLEQSFSAQGLKWRMESWRTGRPLSEVILLRTLVYRVEQVYLIHRRTGLLLQHVSAGEAGVQDADMISGMLTAIRDFVQDSFGGGEADSLDTFQVGELTVWIEQGPHAVLAGVVRGNAPHELRSTFLEALERIHLEQGAALEAFEGDAAPFERARPHLEACLKGQRRGRPGRGRGAGTRTALRFLRAAVVVLLVALGAWSFFSLRRGRRWQAYLDRLEASPGIAITDSGRRGGKFFVTGLRDPLAADPAAMLRPARLDAAQVDASWRPYYALAPEIIAARARSILETPATVKLAVNDGVLVATGSAPRRWIDRARDLSRAIPGVTRFDGTALADMDDRDLQAAAGRIEGGIVLFARGSSEIAPGGTARLEKVAAEMRRLPQLAAAAGKEVRVEVVGRGDSEGTQDLNLALSRRRAERVLAALRSIGVDRANLAAVGVGASAPLREERTEEDREVNRSVSFRLVLTEAGGRGSGAR